MVSLRPHTLQTRRKRRRYPLCGPQSSLDDLEKTGISCTCWDTYPGPFILQYSHYADRATSVYLSCRVPKIFLSVKIQFTKWRVTSIMVHVFGGLHHGKRLEAKHFWCQRRCFTSGKEDSVWTTLKRRDVTRGWGNLCNVGLHDCPNLLLAFLNVFIQRRCQLLRLHSASDRRIRPIPVAARSKA
jgi:hypothetical protein